MEKLSDIIQSSQLTLVDFYATWCGPCRMMHPVLEQLKKELGDSIRIVKVDVDKNEAVAMQMRIQSVPTLMIFKEGEMKWRQSGAMPSSELKRVIAQFQ
ncbi:thioredoxin [Prevotella sp. P5-126]|jgi:thioredoxin 1|uniref:Thioredoxin n=1 Tax=Xylanibacter brevis TaxID=83231 RepID=A0ABS9CJ46_9BACT|nr:MULTISPECIES: thioredoxin [Prevotellaceae]MBS7319817.1 thioredoxin [Prevotella sp.]MCF2564317.1 thioredoxin [Xylanibacter brevis]MCI7001160.1 thioredoxin [Prevotella sp.]OYP40232.1 thioredoxin [Prevotella sp. P5-50]OYP40939.1 thioredoxin [Prevotella sp. P5-126]